MVFSMPVIEASCAVKTAQSVTKQQCSGAMFRNGTSERRRSIFNP
jgi:hypothetical protein